MRKTRKIVKAAILLTVCAGMLIQPVFAVPMVEPRWIDVVVYADEEFIWAAQWLYWYDWKTLANIFVEEASYYFYLEFNVELKIYAYGTWDSNNAVTDGFGMLEEVRAEACWSQDNDTHPKRVLIALTGQDIEPDAELPVYGCTYWRRWYYCVVLCELRSALTDNIIQHEITHLYGVDDHKFQCDCVMWRLYDGCSTNWCSQCKERIWQNRDILGGKPPPHAGGGPNHLLGEGEA